MNLSGPGADPGLLLDPGRFSPGVPDVHFLTGVRPGPCLYGTDGLTRPCLSAAVSLVQALCLSAAVSPEHSDAADVPALSLSVPDAPDSLLPDGCSAVPVPFLQDVLQPLCSLLLREQPRQMV